MVGLRRGLDILAQSGAPSYISTWCNCTSHTLLNLVLTRLLLAIADEVRRVGEKVIRGRGNRYGVSLIGLMDSKV